MNTSLKFQKALGGRYVASWIQRVTERAGSFRSFLPMLAISLAFLFLPAGSTLLSSATSSGAVPVIKVIAVNRDNSVTIRTSNFPAHQTFTATMGRMGTRGINGYVVGTVNSGAGGTFDVSFPIPSQLYESYQISIRLQTAHANPYYSYNWFYNNTTGNTGGVPPTSPTPQPPVHTGIPTFRIVSVTKGTSATIETNNYPAGQTFTVTMGRFGTRGINGIVVGTLNSGAGGTLTASYLIPDALKGLDRIAIRAQTAHANPYYSYNWFWNNNANASSVGTGAVEPESPPPPAAGYTGIPTMWITAVSANNSVTFQTNNYPPGQTFTVTEGRMGTRGINGIVVGQFNSGAGGSFSITMPIPEALYPYSQISIRAQTGHANPYYSYNWFFNNTTP